jgi:hypothetical protein
MWSVAIRDEHRFIVSENGVLRRIFGLMREKETEIKQIFILLNFMMCIIRHRVHLVVDLLPAALKTTKK